MLDLLADPTADEWRHKVGVAGPLDGSAKPTTRLVASRGWVLKTRTDQAFPSADAAREEVLKMRAPGRRASLWHADKVWAVMHADGAWYPLTLCPELVTLRRLQTLDERLAAWVEMLQAGLDVYRLHRLGLDLNPANFAREGGRGRIYYLDDELYDVLDERNVAGAIAARIPEEPSAAAQTWHRWGATLRESLSFGDLRREAIADEVRRYPVPERYEASRDALSAALMEPGPSDRRRRDGRSRALTCVLADVHANLPALEAVVRDARARGAERFLFLGDAIGYGPHPRECVRLLAELPRATLVRGNHDHAIATGRFELGMNSLARACAAWTRSALGPSELSWLAALPTEHVDDGWLAVHGAPKDPHRFLAYVYELTYEDNLRHLREQRIPLCFYGHTHVQLAHVELASGTSKLPGPRRMELGPRQYWLVNPGSVGQPRDADPRAAYALWDRDAGEIATLRVAYDLERTLSGLRAADLPPQLEQRLRAGT